MNGSNAMELDDMKAAWAQLNQRLEAQETLNFHLLRDGKLDRLRRGLRPLVWGQAIQIAWGGLIALWGANFWIAHRDVPHLLIAGIAVHLSGISMIVLGAAIEALIARVDYSAPVLGIQRQIAQLRTVYVRGGLAVGLPWWLLWVAFLMVALKSLAGADLFLNAPGVVWINLAFGVVGLLATLAFLRWSRTRPGLGQKLADYNAGRSIVRAQSLLAEIARFERDQ
ncbi:MAG: serine/threonine protein kinase [Proteobacteria bacterium]|nr:serine/threonine protein kinase [Pseudomonadota bacterium]